MGLEVTRTIKQTIVGVEHLGNFRTGFYEKALCELFFIWISESGGDTIYTYFFSKALATILVFLLALGVHVL